MLFVTHGFPHDSIFILSGLGTESDWLIQIWIDFRPLKLGGSLNLLLPASGNKKKYLIFPVKLLSLPHQFPVMIDLRWMSVKVSRGFRGKLNVDPAALIEKFKNNHSHGLGTGRVEIWKGSPGFQK
jgi:hypothetical protein